MKPLAFLGNSQDDIRAMPAAVRHALGVELMHAFQKKTQKTRVEDIELAAKRYRLIGA
jgi:phage-related protein